MNRREFMQRVGATAGVAAALRAGNWDGAQAVAADTAEATGLKHTIYNMKEYGVKGDGVTDDLPAILEVFQRAGREVGGHPSVTYFYPAGRYLLGDTLQSKYNGGGGDAFSANYVCQYIGQGRMLTQLVLKPGADGFQDPEKPKYFTRDHRAGQHQSETLGTIYDSFVIIASEDGSNPGAIGTDWRGHFGVSRNLFIRSACMCYDGMTMGVGGLHALENLTCVGGRTSIRFQGGLSIQSVCCLDVSETGIHVGPPIPGSLHNVYTRGKGPGLSVAYNHISVTGARFEADPAGQEAAIVNHNGGLTCCMVETVGYKQMVRDLRTKRDLAAAVAPVSALSFYSSQKQIVPPGGRG